MKTKILLSFFLAVATMGFAQMQPSFGVRGGLTSSSMRGNAVNNFNNLLDLSGGMVSSSSRTGFFAGGYVTVPVSDVVSIEPALYYSQKGYDVTGKISVKAVDFLSANATASIVSSYIDLPVVIKANFGGVSLFAGPQVSYLANADLKTSAGVLGLNLLSFKTDMSDQLNRWDAAVTGGVGYQFQNGLNLMASYDYGLSKADANRTVASYNTAFKLGLGMRF